MKGIRDLIFCVFLLAIPLAGECKTVAYSPSNPGQPLIFHFNTSFNQMQPSQFSAVTWTQLQNALLIQSSYSQHLDNLPIRNCCECAQWNIWAEGMGQWLQQNSGHKHQVGYNDSTGGITIGADTYFNDFLVGVAASYTYSDLRWKHSAGHSQINNYYGGLYGRWNSGCFYVNASALGAYNDYSKTRHFQFRTIDRHAHASHNGWEALVGVEAGVTLQDVFCSIDLVPFVGVDYVYLSQQSHSEDGADRFNLHINGRNDQLIQSEIGLQFTRRIPYEFCCQSWTIAPNLSVSYINQTPLTGRTYYTSFVGRGSEFSVKGWEFERNLGAVGFSLNFFDCAETISFNLNYDGQFGSNYWNQTGGIMCNYSF